MAGNRRVWNIAKAVAPGQDWTGEAGSWMSSLESNSIANEDKNFVRKQRYPFDEDEGRTIDADANVNKPSCRLLQSFHPRISRQ